MDGKNDLRPYGEPARFQPRRNRWPGIVALAVIGGGLALIALSSVDLEDGAEALRTSSEKPVVAERQAAQPGDAGITEAVKTALANDPALGAAKIDVSTHDGVVVLSGAAPDDITRDRAGLLAAAAPGGVRGVDNRVVVAPPSPRS